MLLGMLECGSACAARLRFMGAVLTWGGRLLVASDAYHHALSRKKESEALNDDAKLLAIDALGIVMTIHGEDYGEDSLYGELALALHTGPFLKVLEM